MAVSSSLSTRSTDPLGRMDLTAKGKVIAFVALDMNVMDEAAAASLLLLQLNNVKSTADIMAAKESNEASLHVVRGHVKTVSDAFDAVSAAMRTLKQKRMDLEDALQSLQAAVKQQAPAGASGRPAPA